MAILLQAYPVADDNFGITPCFGFFAVTCLIGTFIVLFYLPETKDKTETEILRLFNIKYDEEFIKNNYSQIEDN